MSALDVITIRDSARGNGVADDAPAFNTAISGAQAAGGGTISVDVGTYKLGSTVTVPSTVTVILQQGATFTGTGSLTTSGTGAILDHRGPAQIVYNVMSYGAKGDGVTDDTAAFTRCVTAILGSANPVSNKRQPAGPMYIPAGTFLIQPDQVQFVSVEGLRVYGAGQWRTTLLISGNGTNGLLFDGMAFAHISDFGVQVNSGTCTNGITIQWSGSGVSQRSTFGNVFQNVQVTNAAGAYVNAFNVGGSASNSNQNDGNVFVGCAAYGNWASGNSSTYQTGWLLGSGGAGNNLNHYFYGCNAQLVANAVNAKSVNFFWYGGESAGHDTVYLINNCYQNYAIVGVNTESCTRLVDYENATSVPGTLTLQDCLMRGNQINADGQWIKVHAAYDSINILNCKLSGPGAVAPVIRLDSFGHPMQVFMVGMEQAATYANGVNADAAAFVTSMGYTQTDPNSDARTASETCRISGVGFYGAAPQTQQNGTGNTHTVAAGATTNVFTNTTFDGSTGSTAYTVGDIVKALKNYGLLAA